MSRLPSVEQAHSNSVNRRAFSREGGHMVIDLRQAYIADGANGGSLRADRSSWLTDLCFVVLCIGFNGAYFLNEKSSLKLDR